MLIEGIRYGNPAMANSLFVLRKSAIEEVGTWEAIMETGTIILLIFVGMGAVRVLAQMKTHFEVSDARPHSLA